MKFFDSPTNDKLTRLLKQSQLDFKLDQATAKTRLLQAIARGDLESIQPARMWRSLIVKSGVSLVGVVLVISGTFATAAGAQPGDKLFAVNKLREQLILSLPLSAQTRAQVETNIVEARFKALDTIPDPAEAETKTVNNHRLETIKESQESLNRAVEAISAKQADFQEQGDVEQAENLDRVLTNLAQMASSREQTIKNLSEQTSDETERAEIKVQLDKFRSSRHKAEIRIDIHSNK
jgi:hypothetical protein